MQERQPEPTEIDDTIEDKVTRLMDTRGISRSDAERILAVRENAGLTFTRVESIQQHPSARSRQPYRYNGRPPVGYDSEDVFTGILSEEQVATNATGAALVRAAIHAGELELTPHERAIARAKAEKKNRNYS